MAPEKNVVSVSPEGEEFAIPRRSEYEAEYRRVEELVKRARASGREVVVVLGVGFVGAVMAAVVADARDGRGRCGKFVIGVQRPSPRSFWKIPLLNRGASPVKAEDPEVEVLIKRCVLEEKNLIATYNVDVLKLADVVIVDVQCDFLKAAFGDLAAGRTDMEALEQSFHTVAERIGPETLVLIETTVAPGTTEGVAFPIMKKAFERRGIGSDPLLAHSYERVMPGRDYVKSIRDFWRVCSGVSPAARERVVAFLSSVLNVKDFPLTVLDKPIESETAKIVENSYRAAILAFMDEWSVFAERHGVDLLKVIKAIKVRPTHSNIMFPGPGIGGYCLPKDGGLGMWAHRHLLGGEDDILKMTPLAINVNDTRPARACRLVREALQAAGRSVTAALVVLLGASYREDVGDTRYSGSEVIVRRLTEMGAEMRVHDPYVAHWWEFEAQDEYPASGASLARFFRNQEKLKSLRVEPDLDAALMGADAVVLAVRHKQYLALEPAEVVKKIGRPAAIVDCFAILDDEKIRRYLELGCEVRGLGRGHVGRIRDEVGKSKA
jgi:UDP-N-acetyl-D-glucosamine dehydrogenase